jgi:hypothetical protein
VSEASAKPWFEDVFAQLEALEEVGKGGGPLADFEAFPPWVKNVLREIVSAANPALLIRNFNGVTPEVAGRFLGQHLASVHAVDKQIPRLEQLAAKLPVPLSDVTKHRAHPLAELLEHSLENGAFAEQWLPRFREVLLSAFERAVDDGTHEEAAAFFQGFAAGLSTKRGELAHHLEGSTAHPIYLRLFLDWPSIERLGSVRELYEYLQRKGMTRAQLGEQKRLEKICQRMGLTFREPGRPPKNTDTSPA